MRWRPAGAATQVLLLVLEPREVKVKPAKRTKGQAETEHAMSFQDRIDAEIPADVHMISGCQDVQTSADATITNFGLPDPAGRQVTYAVPVAPSPCTRRDPDLTMLSSIVSDGPGLLAREVPALQRKPLPRITSAPACPCQPNESYSVSRSNSHARPHFVDCSKCSITTMKAFLKTALPKAGEAVLRARECATGRLAHEA